MKWRWAIILLLAVTALGRSAISGQYDIVTRMVDVLRSAGWPGEWSDHCTRRSNTGIHIYRSVGDDGIYPEVTTLADGKVVAEFVVVAAEMNNAGLKVVVRQDIDYGRLEATIQYARQGSRMWIVAQDGQFDATEAVPPGVYSFAPDGLEVGQYVRFPMAANGVMLEPDGTPSRPVTVYEKCSEAQRPPD